RLADIDVHFAEVALDRFPGAARGDAHLLMVVTGRTARGESVAEPEVVVDGEFVGDVGEGRRAFVGGGALRLDGFAPAARRQALGNEAAFGADRDDYRVFHVLRFDEAEDLGAE